jgi:Mrp family chromosome partitioning ATPase
MTWMLRALERSEAERPVDAQPVLRRPHRATEHRSLKVAGPAEDYERLKVMLTLALGASEVRPVMVLSALPREGATTIARGIATALAEGGRRRVLLIEAAQRNDARRIPRDAPHGLADVLVGHVGPHAVIQATTVAGLRVLPSGRRPLALGSAASLEAFDRAIDALAEDFDGVLVDGGSLRRCPGSLLVAGRMRGVVLVVEAERTGFAVAADAAERLKSAGANVLGVVLNRRRDYVPRFIASRI